MYCPKCKQEFPGKYCPECGEQLIDAPLQKASGIGITISEDAAVMGGLNFNDSHNTSNNNYNNSTTNITQVAAQKSAMEQEQENRRLYLNACKRACEDLVLEENEKLELELYSIQLGLNKKVADGLEKFLWIIYSENDDIKEVEKSANLLIPPALAGVPLALTLVFLLFDEIGLIDEAKKWGNKLMSLDPKSEDTEVMIAKRHIYLSENKIYGLNTGYATAFFRAAAAKGSLEALCHIANMYYEGDGVDTDYNMAITWAKMAYEASAPLGLYIYRLHTMKETA